MTTILVVDDDSGIRGMVKEMLEQAGYEVRLAASGEEAMLVDLTQVDLITVDNQMGKDHMSGPAFVRSVRARPYDGVIIGMSSSKVGKEFLAAGATEFFDKALLIVGDMFVEKIQSCLA